MDQKRFTTFLALGLSIALIAGCASTDDVTRREGAMTGAAQGAQLAIEWGTNVATDEHDGIADALTNVALGFAVALVAMPVFALVGSVTGALSVTK